MKKSLVGVLFLFVFLAFSVQTVGAAEYHYSIHEPSDINFSMILSSSKAWQDEHWKEEILDNPHYSKAYSIKGCTIYTYKDGNGVRILANDPDWPQGSLTQIVEIRKLENNRLNIKERYFYYNGEFYVPRPPAYSVFYVKYLEKAKNLPESVKEKFYGCFTFGELPSSK